MSELSTPSTSTGICDEFRCLGCGVGFGGQNELTLHQKEAKKECCPACLGLTNHNISHNNACLLFTSRDTNVNSRIECDNCGTSFVTKKSLQRHKKRGCCPKCLHPQRAVRHSSCCKRTQQSGKGKQLPVVFSPLSAIDEARVNRLKNLENNSSPLVTGDDKLDAIISENWTSIVSKYRVMKVSNIVNVRATDDGTIDKLWTILLDVWNDVSSKVKINCSLGLVLEHKSTGELRYFHSSPNNAAELPVPRLISSQAQLKEFYSDLKAMDLRESAVKRRPTSGWRVRLVTNITFYLFKMNGLAKIGSGKDLIPSFVLRNKSILCLHRSPATRKVYTDKLCFFRCLAVKLACRCIKDKCACVNPQSRDVLRLFEKYKKAKSLPITPKSFEGVDFGELLFLEELFNIRIVVMKLNKDHIASVEWSSEKSSGVELHLNISNNHFSFIKNPSVFAKSFACELCGYVTDRSFNLFRHRCDPNKTGVMQFSGGCFAPSKTIFDKLRLQLGIRVDQRRQMYPFRITYDIECYMDKSNELPVPTPTTSYSARHELLSVSCCSNVPGFTTPRCFVTTGNTDECVGRFVDYLVEVSETASKILFAEYKDVFSILKHKKRQMEEVEDCYCDSNWSRIPCKGSIAHNLEEQFIDYLNSIPVVGFNSQKYDLNVIKGYIINHLLRVENKGFRFIVKRTSSLTCLQSSHFRFLDVVNFIAPGFTYSKYLQAYGCEEQKGFFPYEWVDDLSKLDHPCLPPREDFFSTLTNKGITEDEYQFCQSVWNEKKMTKFKDFLEWYNNLDVVPFLEALDNQCEVYAKKGLDMLKSAISLPGLAVHWLFTEVAPHQSLIPKSSDRSHNSITFEEIYRKVSSSQQILLIDNSLKDLYTLIRNNLVGGPSIVFHRYHESQKTFLRQHTLGSKAKQCQRILGVDANALYLYCMMQNMPTGYPRRRQRKNGFQAEKVSLSKSAYGWLCYQEYISNCSILHGLNVGEVDIGLHKLPVDGYCEETRTVYQFHGCYWHGHGCRLSPLEDNVIHPSDPKKRTVKQIRHDTIHKDNYVQELGYQLVVIWECEWSDFLGSSPSARTFVKAAIQGMFGSNPSLSEEEILNQVRSGKLYGFVECDIVVPSELTEKFSEMAPIFKNVKVSRSDLSPHMKEVVQNSDYLSSPQRMLIGSLKGNKILLLTDLLRWYLSHGLVVTKIHQVFEYIPRKVFASFGESVSNARREGDLDPTKSLLASTAKLIGNSVYGKTITNKEKHKKVLYTSNESEASIAIRSNFFVSIEEIGADVFEVISQPKKLLMNIPVTVGFTILQLAKLRMLEFYYDFMDKFFDRADFQYVEMDTDSAYMGLSSHNLESIIRPHLRVQFYNQYSQWFPRQACDNHTSQFISTKLDNKEWKQAECCKQAEKYDQRTPGLFKEEFAGDGIIALNSKTYYCWNKSTNDHKLSSKGLSKKTNDLQLKHYFDVLHSHRSFTGINKGFAIKNGQTYTYNQLRTGLTYFYAKRQVENDGVSTSNLDL